MPHSRFKHTLLPITGVLLVSTIFFFSACQQQSAQVSSEQPTTATTSLSEGEKLFQVNCVRCHASFSDRANPVITSSSSMQSLEHFTKQLREPTSPMMKAFPESELDASSIATLYTHLKQQLEH